MPTNGKCNGKNNAVTGLLKLPFFKDGDDKTDILSPVERAETKAFITGSLRKNFDSLPAFKRLREHRIAQLRGTWRGLVLQKMEKGQYIELSSGDVIQIEEDIPFIFSVTATMMVKGTSRIDGELVINFDYRYFGYDMDETPIGRLIGKFLPNNSTVILRFRNNNKEHPLHRADIRIELSDDGAVMGGSYIAHGLRTNKLVEGHTILRKVKKESDREQTMPRVYEASFVTAQSDEADVEIDHTLSQKPKISQEYCKMLVGTWEGIGWPRLDEAYMFPATATFTHAEPDGIRGDCTVEFPGHQNSPGRTVHANLQVNSFDGVKLWLRYLVNDETVISYADIRCTLSEDGHFMTGEWARGHGPVFDKPNMTGDLILQKTS